ncbi:NAD(+) diphosphatase [Luteimicrobium sp. DT211]|uniref:NAD(+) diphosphatase n=1 Tax=Luteimicrobium sp. DT211 TaxID=3393412 RepID=UPI003CEEF602
MTDLPSVPPGPFAALPLTTALDRAAERRTAPGELARALADDATRVLLVHRAHVPVTGAARLDLLPAAAVRDPAFGPPSDAQPVARWILLGEVEGATVLALVVPDAADATAPGIEGIAPQDVWSGLLRDRQWRTVREAAVTVPDDEAALAAEATAVAQWHDRAPRCPHCGEPTVVTDGGWVRRCEAEGIAHFPRTDPAVIMAVVDEDDRLLLGRSAAWPEGRFSTLAGFVEPGESAEQAVRREVREESGVDVGEVAFRGSQPWPFPSSLMLGFRARARTTALHPDGVELAELRWVTRDELRDQVARGALLPPGRVSIARALIEEWFGGPLPTPAAEA